MKYADICMKDLSLRDYQQEAKEKIFSQWDHVDNVMYQMPTGTGKTRLFTSIIRDISVWGLRSNNRPRILIVAHRTELIVQIHRSLKKYHVSHGVIAGCLKGERKLAEPVQIASIQTITSSSNRNIAENLNIDFIIIDEAHHAIANSYKKLWSYYPESKKLGVTATPWRMNGCGFTEIFDVLIPSMPIADFMKKGWLSSYQYFSIPANSGIEASIAGIKDFDKSGDYKVNAMERVLDNDHIRAQLLDSYKQLAFKKKGIIYSISRTHSEHICVQYRNIGVRIVNIDSETPEKIREQYVEDFKNGFIDIIVNVDIFSEGFDCPDIEFIQLARPTKSLVKYLQQVGRGLRKNGDKHCIILDNVGMYNHFGLPDSDHPWEDYFYGKTNPLPTSNTSSERDFTDVIYRERDLSEGSERMLLIQNIEFPSPEQTDQIQDNVDISVPKPVNDSQDSVNILPHNSFSVKSNPFFSSKFIIEENELGYFIANLKTRERCFLFEYGHNKTGQISIKRIDGSNYSIIRTIPFGLGTKPKNMLLGTIRKEGQIIKIKPCVSGRRSEISFS